jgi:hypothetical protein
MVPSYTQRTLKPLDEVRQPERLLELAGALTWRDLGR